MAAGVGVTSVAPTQVAGVVEQAWTSALGVDGADGHDNFFALGGDSLTAMRLLGAIQEETGLPVTYSDLLNTPDLGPFIDHLSRMKADGSGGRVSRRARVGPLTPVQLHHWRSRKGHSSAEVYWAYEIEGGLDIEALRGALQELVRRHEILRSTFRRRFLRARQVVGPVRDDVLRVVDLSDMGPKQHRTATALRQIVEEDYQSFDFSRGPLLRATLAIIGPRRYIFSIAGSEMVIDASVRRLFASALGTLYELLHEGKSAEDYPYPRMQFSDYVAHRKALVNRSGYQDQLLYWREKVRSLEPGVEVAGVVERGPDAKPVSPPVRTLQLTRDAVADVRRTGRELSTSAFNVLTAAFAVVLHAVAENEAPAFTTTFSHRDVAGADELIGSFYNNVLVAVPLGEDVKSGADVVAATVAATSEAFQHSEVPLGMVLQLRKAHPTGTQLRSDSVRFQLHTHPGEIRFPGVRMRPVQPPWTPALDLYLSATETPSGALDLSFTCRADLPRVIVENTLPAYRRVLRLLTSDPDVPADDLLHAAKTTLRR